MVFRYRSRTHCVAARFAAMVLVATPILATPTTTTLNFELGNPTGSPISNLFVYAVGDGQNSLIASPDTLASTGAQSLSFSTPFIPSELVVAGLNVGLDDGVEHIILFANDPFAQSATGLKWSNFFAPVRHSVFVDTLKLASGGDAASLAALDHFFQDAPAAAARFGPDDSFTILQFTTGIPVGVGPVVPESGTVAAALGSLGLVAAFGIRRYLRSQG